MVKAEVNINQVKSQDGKAYMNFGDATVNGITAECYPFDHYIALIKVRSAIRLVVINDKGYLKEFYDIMNKRFAYGYEILWESDDLTEPPIVIENRNSHILT